MQLICTVSVAVFTEFHQRRQKALWEETNSILALSGCPVLGRQDFQERWSHKANRETSGTSLLQP